MARPIAVDLFAGAGGMSLGFEQAGFDVVAAVEVDPVHAAVHAFNFPECAVICRDISLVTPEFIRAEAGIGDARVDLVVGGAPCQGFSLIGQRVLDDPRNGLVRQFIRLVKGLDASYFVFENVKGLTLGPSRAFLDELITTFQDLGYNVRHPWKVLNASNFGVPQNRERLILLGAKKGLTLPSYPDDVGVRINCEQALGDLPDCEKYATLENTDEVKLKKSAWGKPSDYAKELRCVREFDWHFGYQRNWDPFLLTSSMRTEHTDITRRRFETTVPGTVHEISRFFKLHPRGISNTLRAGTDAARGAFTSPRPIHYKFGRCISVREMARLHGFPDWFRLHQTKWHGAREVGNAVPPALARAAGNAVAAAMHLKRRRPARKLDLGSGDLLRMTVREAAEYWGIPAPCGKRDRKNGLKKRSQAETERMQRLEAVE